MRFNKKGQVEEVPFVLVMIFIIGFLFFFGLYIMNKISGSIAPALEAQAPGAGNIINSVNSFANNAFNGFFLFVIVGLILALLITAFLSFIHPVFLLIFAILLVPTIIVSTTLSNAYEKISGLSEFSSVINNLRILNYIMLHLPYFIAIIGILFLIILFAKTRQNSQTVGVQ